MQDVLSKRESWTFSSDDKQYEGFSIPEMNNEGRWDVLLIPRLWAQAQHGLSNILTHFIFHILKIGSSNLRFVWKKGRMGLPKRINFWKSSKEGGGVIFNPKIYNADFGPLHRALNRAYLETNCKMIFRKWGGGIKGHLEFFRKFIWPVPKSSLTMWNFQFEFSSSDWQHSSSVIKFFIPTLNSGWTT